MPGGAQIHFGMRKVLGASTAGIAALLTGEFARMMYPASGFPQACEIVWKGGERIERILPKEQETNKRRRKTMTKRRQFQ